MTSILSYGAVGDGVTDDTTALQNAFNAGGTIDFLSGYVFLHSAVLNVPVAGTTMTTSSTTPSEIRANTKAASNVNITANNVTVNYLKFTMPGLAQSDRGSSFAAQKLTLYQCSGAVLNNIQITGSWAAGIYVFGASNYTITSPVIKGTAADGIHQTFGANNGTITNPVIGGTTTADQVGDDMISVVSYLTDLVVCHDITVTNLSCNGNWSGRGISAVGGYNITYSGGTVSNSSAAGAYIGCETGTFSTYTVENINVKNITFTNCNFSASPDQGTLFVLSNQDWLIPQDVFFNNITVTGSATSHTRDFGVIDYTTNGHPLNIVFNNLNILSNGPGYQGNAPAGSYTIKNFTLYGTPQANTISPTPGTSLMGVQQAAVTTPAGIVPGAVNTAAPTNASGTATGSLTLSSAVTGRPAGTATDALSLAAANSTASVSIPGSGTGATTFAANGTGTVPGTATDALALAASSTGAVRGTATDPLAINGSTATGTPAVAGATGTDALALNGAVTGAVTGTGSDPMSLSGNVTGKVAGTATDNLTLTGLVTGVPSIPGTATGSLALTSTTTGSGSGTATGAESLVANLVATPNIAGTPTGAVAVLGAASVGTGSGTATGAMALALTGFGATNASGNMTLGGTLTGSLAMSGTATAALGLGGLLTGSVKGTASGASTLGGAVNGGPSFPVTATGSTVLNGNTAAGTPSITGTATDPVTLAVSSAGTGNGSGSGAVSLGGTANGFAIGQGSATGAIAVNSTSTGTTIATATGALAVLATNNFGTVTFSGTATAALGVSGNSSSGYIHGTSSGSISLAGAVVGSGVLPGGGSGALTLTGTVAGTVNFTGIATANMALVGNGVELQQPQFGDTALLTIVAAITGDMRGTGNCTLTFMGGNAQSVVDVGGASGNANVILFANEPPITAFNGLGSGQLGLGGLVVGFANIAGTGQGSLNLYGTVSGGADGTYNPGIPQVVEHGASVYSSTIDNLIARARLEMGDQGMSFSTPIVADGFTTIVQIPNKPVDPRSITVSSSVSGTLTPGVDYTLDAKNGQIVLRGAAQSTPSVLTVTGSAYRFFSDDDWSIFVNTAVIQHLHGTYKDLAHIPPVEEYPVAILAVIEALWALKNDATFDINITTPEGVSIPRAQRFAQIDHMLVTRQEQYNQLCAVLNVGLNRIEMFTLRRKALSTEKLVPVYIPQEWSDSRPPYEVYPAIDVLDTSGRTEPEVQPLFTLDLLATAFQPFSQNITGLGDLTNQTIRGSVRMYPAAYQPLAYMLVTVIDAANGIVNISMNDTITYFVGVSKFWDLQAVDKTTGYRRTLVNGRFDAVRQGNG